MAEVRPVSATSAREWIETGEQCMERRLFDQVRTHATRYCFVSKLTGWTQALKCFKNANDTRRILWAEGSVAELKGRECRATGDTSGFKSYFGEASRLFYGIGMKERAAGCMEAVGDFAGAGSKAPGLFAFSGIYLTRT